VRVREVDIDNYVEDILYSQESESESIYKEQIAHYCTFIKTLVTGNKILSRRFYVIIPYHDTEKTKDFSLIKEHMYLSRDIIIRGLEKLGMKARQLTSLELLDLFYSFYNPVEAKTQPLQATTIEALLKHTYA
jgi:hypothetical protein